MTDSIQKYEQKHLDGVITKVQEAIAKSSKDAKKAETDSKSIDKNFSNEVRINTSTYSGMMDTAISVRQQQQLLSERQNSWQHASQQLNVLKRLEKRPYFARIDFHEAGEKSDETIYIGLGSFSDTPDHFLIYDWRAPISSVYYDGELGNVSYETPDGTQEVDVKLKRQFTIEDGKIVTVFDTNETIGDQMLLKALGNSSDTKMKSIVSTIQKEQNKIIRDTHSDLLFVQGAAGSGKTAAILQRVAYLLYRYRGNLTASQVIMFSPNQIFNDYVDQVLPELGEHNMVQMTYYQFTKRRIPNMEVETLQQRFESRTDSVSKKIRTLENSLVYFDAVTKYAEHLGSADMKFRNLMFHDKPFASQEKIQGIYYGYNENYRLGNRLDATKEALLKSLNSRIGSEVRSKWAEQAVQSLNHEDLEKLYGGEPKEFDDSDKEFKFLARKLVIQALQPVRNAIVHNRFLNINAQYVHFLRSVPHLINLEKAGLTQADWQTYVEEVVASLKNHAISLNNTSAYLYLYDLIVGKKGERDMRYVFIDEIQDYTAFQLAYLKYNYPRAKFTLLGDLNQSIYSNESTSTLLAELSTMFDKEKTRVIQLEKSYRSTQQITDFTKEILKNGEAIEAFHREGDLPVVSVKPSFDLAVKRVQAQMSQNQKDGESTAIIGKSVAECQKITEGLRNQGERVTLIKTENQRLAEGVVVVPSYLAKGLEFDAVIVWDASDAMYHDEDERQLLYTICSRAMHRLTIVATEKMSRLLDRIDSSLYKLD
ncbi:DNA helicase [Pediococcus damnosus]|uniref:RNA polymerase recycling motor HelD n=1 Tax=Pediococcus damnosus TaxID=51663 RepID=UPI00078E16DC|nr:RNA polymerase recycling motor HelD [Pediococcus damnosus]AMV61010.1 DNA helicase [Pediococcus damnosus]AMV65370.1 DNA helicase [Pediococcus damnosus]PIO80580.1 ATP-dependent DNA helicase [Pediococcus damnosus]